jgi:hypothetical protein
MLPKVYSSVEKTWKIFSNPMENVLLGVVSFLHQLGGPELGQYEIWVTK